MLDVGAIIYAKYQVIKMLDGGACGLTGLCKNLVTNEEIVLKQQKPNEHVIVPTDKGQTFHKEIHHWLTLPYHQNVVPLLGAFEDETHTWYMVMPFIHGHKIYGLNLREWRKNKYPFEPEDIMYIAISVCNSMIWIHEHHELRHLHGEQDRSCHKDIKPENIFVNWQKDCTPDDVLRDGIIMLSDFGATGSDKRYYNDRIKKAYGNTDADISALVFTLKELASNCDDEFLECFNQEYLQLNESTTFLELKKKFCEIARKFYISLPEDSTKQNIFVDKAIELRKLNYDLKKYRKNNGELERMCRIRWELEETKSSDTLIFCCSVDRGILEAAISVAEKDIANKIFQIYYEDLAALKMVMDEQEFGGFYRKYLSNFSVDWLTDACIFELQINGWDEDIFSRIDFSTMYAYGNWMDLCFAAIRNGNMKVAADLKIQLKKILDRLSEQYVGHDADQIIQNDFYCATVMYLTKLEYVTGKG